MPTFNHTRNTSTIQVVEKLYITKLAMELYFVIKRKNKTKGVR